MILRGHVKRVNTGYLLTEYFGAREFYQNRHPKRTLSVKKLILNLSLGTNTSHLTVFQNRSTLTVTT